MSSTKLTILLVDWMCHQTRLYWWHWIIAWYTL